MHRPNGVSRTTRGHLDDQGGPRCVPYNPVDLQTCFALEPTDRSGGQGAEGTIHGERRPMGIEEILHASDVLACRAFLFKWPIHRRTYRCL